MYQVVTLLELLFVKHSFSLTSLNFQLHWTFFCLTFFCVRKPKVLCSSSAARYLKRGPLCKAGGSGREESKKQPPPSPAFLCFENVHERKPDRKKTMNRQNRSFCDHFMLFYLFYPLELLSDAIYLQAEQYDTANTTQKTSL